AFGYEGNVIYPLALTWRAEGEALTVEADLDYLVCEVDCVPYSYTLTLEQPLAANGAEPAADPEIEARLAGWVRQVPRQVAEVAGVETTGRLDLADPDRPVLEVTLAGAAAVGGEEPQIFLETHELFDFDRPERSATTDGGFRFRVPLTWFEQPDAPLTEADFAWTVTGLALDGEGAAAVEARRTVTTTAAPAPAATTAGGPPPGLVSLLGAALAGGLLLNLAPTLLPLWLVGIGRVTKPALGAGALGAFAGAVALVPLAALGRSSGLPAAWGAPLQEPVAVAALATFATVAALSLWGLLRWPVPTAERTGGLLAGFALGVVSVLLALPWNAPLVPGAVGPALGAGTGTALAVFAALGLGLAAPWLAAALLPRFAATLARLAGPDGRLGEALAFVEAGAAFWIFYLLSHQVTSVGIAFVQLTLLGVALAAWWHAVTRRRGAKLVTALLVVALAAAGLWLADDHRRSNDGRRGGDHAATGMEAESEPVQRTPRT
ncbi:MAG TPA: hypothetical protein VKU40_08035, partial [Thermoanaerobaculia bacterium]|nr:hypothetical protein [Thermoanaerobaculia bacterium]